MNGDFFPPDEFGPFGTGDVYESQGVLTAEDTFSEAAVSPEALDLESGAVELSAEEIDPFFTEGLPAPAPAKSGGGGFFSGMFAGVGDALAGAGKVAVASAKKGEVPRAVSFLPDTVFGISTDDLLGLGGSKPDKVAEAVRTAATAPKPGTVRLDGFGLPGFGTNQVVPLPRQPSPATPGIMVTGGLGGGAGAAAQIGGVDVKTLAVVGGAGLLLWFLLA